ncbi:LexA family transcriptional regulator [Curvibacter sp. PAE-UM]|uniref:LexA family protein n=1 Tax=Curvibacter sp. PAE-UM TaxID=1714344 RepID=UPI00070B9D63|nr:translesion error-prone DNA polymerase V autoproteolytic subunit [Curvibacter sp. PAE-UM]KRH99157.1 repressor [Curvibacter sp. PAE-UM]
MNSITSGVPVPVAEASVHALQRLDNRVAAGFPSPAEDLGGQRVDLTRELVTHPQATFLLRARGHSMVGAGILDDDILVVNRALVPRHQSVVVAVVDGEFTVKTLWQRAGRVKLQPANPAYPEIVPTDGQTLEIWGVVTAAIHQYVR